MIRSNSNSNNGNMAIDFPERQYLIVFGMQAYYYIFFVSSSSGCRAEYSLMKTTPHRRVIPKLMIQSLSYTRM